MTQNQNAILKDILPRILKDLNHHPLTWERIGAISKTTSHPMAFVRLACSDSLTRLSYLLCEAILHKIYEAFDRIDLEGQRTHEKVRSLLHDQFQTLEEYRSALLNLQKTLSLFHIVEKLYEVVDEIWHRAGDQSTDYNFYTKRLLLGAVYIPTLKGFLKKNLTLEETMDEIDKRLKRVMKIPKLKKDLKSFFKKGLF